MTVDLTRDGIAWADLADGASILGTANGEDVLVVRAGPDVFAVGAACTHYSGPLAEGLVVGHTVRCPWHHACFDLRTGEALRAPALNPLPCWPVERRGDRVFVGAKREHDPLDATGRPSATPSSVVIVGAGGAGAAAAEMLRRRGYTGPITMIDHDPSAPVDRPNLSKDYLAGNAQPEWIPLRPEGFYEEHGITLRRATAVSLDLGERAVRLDGGDQVTYGALILATGAEPKHLPGARVLRSFADSNAIIEAAAHAKHAVVIGSSFIGLEVAASLRTRGLPVTVVSGETRPLEHIVDPRVSTMIRELHEQHGVQFRMGVAVAKVEPSAVTLNDGTSIPADLVVAGIGVRPRVALAEAAGLAMEDGVLVDRYLETSQPGIWAAGDIARWPDPHTGKRLRIEHWVVAERMGQVAAENVLGLRVPFDVVPVFWSQHYDITLRYIGYSQPWTQVDIAGDLATHHAAIAYRAASKTVGFATFDEDRRNLEAEVAMERDDEEGLRL
jgi:NADPH-dependent 2,4-dienoyl-CoA reductase/sulfur reductase-like enzyme/nitrite reductase/ring-hydroxylating ferredoxin subunit